MGNQSQSFIKRKETGSPAFGSSHLFLVHTHAHRLLRNFHMLSDRLVQDNVLSFGFLTLVKGGWKAEVGSHMLHLLCYIYWSNFLYIL